MNKTDTDLRSKIDGMFRFVADIRFDGEPDATELKKIIQKNYEWFDEHYILKTEAISRKDAVVLRGRIKWLESCAESHSEIQNELFNIVVPHLDFPRGKTINTDHCLGFLKTYLKDSISKSEVMELIERNRFSVFVEQADKVVTAVKYLPLRNLLTECNQVEKKCNHKWEVRDKMLDNSGKSYAVWNECTKCGKTKPYNAPNDLVEIRGS
jgi:hypothetical protein